MLEWFIDLAYAFENCPDFFYLLLCLWFLFFLYYEAYLYEKKEDLIEKAENYEKVQEFMEYLFHDKQNLRKEVSDYLRRKKMIENREERQKEIDDFMNIL